MRVLRASLLALCSLVLMAQSKPVLVPDVSARRIEIRYSFTGAQLLLFGAILYPRGRIPEETPDIAVVLRGPVQPILVREKEKIAYIWMNADSARFRSAPAYYAVASSKPLSTLLDERTSAIYEIGLQNLQLSPGSAAQPGKARRVKAGQLQLRKRTRVKVENTRGGEITEGVLYRARIFIPSQVPVGTYTAETFLIQDNKVIAVATRDIEIGKSGFERWVSLVARRHEGLYGLAAVIMSVGLGWAAAMVFRRRF